jgi:hypothetical protein
MLQTTTLKRNLVPRFGEARRKGGFGIIGGLPPLRKNSMENNSIESYKVL